MTTSSQMYLRSLEFRNVSGITPRRSPSAWAAITERVGTLDEAVSDPADAPAPASPVAAPADLRMSARRGRDRI